MPITATAIGTAIAAILAACLPVLLKFWSEQKKEKSANDLIVKTNPPDPAGVADIDRLQRLQDDRNLPPVK